MLVAVITLRLGIRFGKGAVGRRVGVALLVFYLAFLLLNVLVFS